MQIPDTLFGRSMDVEYVRENAARGASCSIVGVSNLGKSALLRSICASAPAPDAPTFVYVDCNGLPERTGRAFVTGVCQALLLRLPQGAVRSELERLYDEMIHAPDALSASIHFNTAFQLAVDHLPQPLILCLDEFDEVYQNLDQQVFLNLRSLRDRHGHALAYVTATSRELERLTQTREQGEFYELIAPRVHFMHWMMPEETRRFCQAFAAREHVTFSAADLKFICENADGHPGLAQAVCFVLGAVTGAPVRNPQQDRVIHTHVLENLAADSNVRTECTKIWNDLEPDERETLLRLHRPTAEVATADAAQNSLRNKFILTGDRDEPRLCAPLFEHFVRQQTLIRRPDERGVYIDVDAGDVWVDGKAIEPLTDLEFRLLLFLYGLDRVCDKYAIVEAVWGEDYIDKVDDTRIEKLISRLRQKIEPDPAHPRYLASLRGRGYKLVR